MKEGTVREYKKGTIEDRGVDSALLHSVKVPDVPALASWELERRALLKLERAAVSGREANLTNGESNALLAWIRRAETA